MSWMANRSTTRVEDMAYCLLGLFGIDMPPLYGEGERAFLRLQREIIQHSDDDSIFAWPCVRGQQQQHILLDYRPGVLAATPKDFAACGGITSSIHNSGHPYRVTNKGIEFVGKAVTVQVGGVMPVVVCFLRLECLDSGEYGHTICDIALRCLAEETRGPEGSLIALGRQYVGEGQRLSRVTLEKNHATAPLPLGYADAHLVGYGYQTKRFYMRMT